MHIIQVTCVVYLCGSRRIALGVEDQEGPGNGQSCEGPQHVVCHLLGYGYLTVRIRPMAIVSVLAR